ncbi:sortase [Patescibacteria group bacterium]|nr:sortase [Patescibacteria group bacterium]
MALYGYLKKNPKKITLRLFSKKQISFLFSVLGMILIGNAVIPIVSYQFRYAPRFGRIISPLVYPKNGEPLSSIAALAKEEERDYTLISSWFDNSVNRLNTDRNKTAFYSISIPKLGIIRAKVEIGGEDLKQILVHYNDTAFPGKLGNAVIFGHSVLPQFFNPENYLTIFSTLYRLREGDEILVDFDGVSYRYLVEDLFEVSPKDLSVLEQRYSERRLSLITCSPPGTYLRRLVVRAKLVD